MDIHRKDTFGATHIHYREILLNCPSLRGLSSSFTVDDPIPVYPACLTVDPIPNSAQLVSL